MISFFRNKTFYFAIQSDHTFVKTELQKLKWLFDNGELISETTITGKFIGPRKEMITPWSTNAVEMAKNMAIDGISRIEQFVKKDNDNIAYDPMLEALYENLTQKIFTVDKQPEPVLFVKNIKEYNEKEGLALNDEEITYLENLSKKLERALTDSEVFGFSQVNSEHCRHKIFNGKFIIDGKEKDASLFDLIKATSQKNPNQIVSAYKDNCAFLTGPEVYQFAPKKQMNADFFTIKPFQSLISVKAETHNFPTTVEPFNGAATGSGGEIRDRMAGGQASIPLAGTAVYMTAFPRTAKSRPWETHVKARNWLYQTPEQILIKASNGASDFGNKFGQALICGSVLTFEYLEKEQMYAYDKVIMLAGGIGFAKKEHAWKKEASENDKIILLGGDNYRIGMGGGAVSSVATGEYGNQIELNAVQRSNPEMQKRVFNAIRAMAEADSNPILSIHDHGAGGHLNCLSELVEDTGGKINMEKLPVGDPTLSAREIAGNESQERMGLILKDEDKKILKKICKRERAPFYKIGSVRNDKRFIFENPVSKEKPIDLNVDDLFGNPPCTLIEDQSIQPCFNSLKYSSDKLNDYLEQVLQLEAVACKDWLTNKVDRSVGGKVALQQCAGELQLPLNNLGISAIDYQTHKGIATAIGHASIPALIDAGKGSRLSVAEALTNIVWTPIQNGIEGISLSANWMWPCNNRGENARLYEAVEAISRFCIELGINIPTGKDSLSMTQKYPNGQKVISPGTVIVSAVGETTDFTKAISPVLKNDTDSLIIYIDCSHDVLKLSGSSFSQVLGKLGGDTPDVNDPAYFAHAFNAVQQLIIDGKILAGHDISAGGMVTTLLEMCFANRNAGLNINLDAVHEKDIVKILFSENPGIIIQIKPDKTTLDFLTKNKIRYYPIGKYTPTGKLHLVHENKNFNWEIHRLRDVWFQSSYLLDQKQTAEKLAKERFDNFKNQNLFFNFPPSFSGRLSQYGLDKFRTKESGVKAAIIREKGVNGDREMAWAMYLAGFDVKDIHMTDLINGSETLDDVNLIIFVGGFANSDVLGSAKGWAGAFLYNKKAKKALDNFYNRKNTLSLGVCNGCQLMAHLGLLGYENSIRMAHNRSGKFESAFVNVNIPQNNTVMLQHLSGSRLGVWVAHGEGRFVLDKTENDYHIPMKYAYSTYPAHPNGSDFAAAAICSSDGRHLAMMPHIERSTYAWNWPHYPENRKKSDEVSPWIIAFVSAKEWIMKNMAKKEKV